MTEKLLTGTLSLNTTNQPTFSVSNFQLLICLSPHRKMKIGIYCYFIAHILTNFFLEMFVEIYFLSEPLNLIGQKAKFAKNSKKSTPQKLYGG